MEPSFSVASEHFSGPLELLLELVEKRKLHINDISLASVAESFIEYVRSKVELPKDELAHFLVVASTLMLIKSVSLLPGLTLTEEEKASIYDLELRLALFQKIKEGAELLHSTSGKRCLFFRSERVLVPTFAPAVDASVTSLYNTLVALTSALPKKESLPEIIIKKVISLEEVIGNLMERVKQTLSISFKDFVGGSREKVDVIVSFLGMLELVKQGAITVSQEEHFSDIKMESADVSVPRYS